MQSLLKAVRDVLVADSTLLALVGAATDIVPSHVAHVADYPVVSLSVSGGGGKLEIAGVTKATLMVQVRSDTSKIEAHNIYDRIQTLLHNQERDITTASCVVHLIYEAALSDAQYDGVGSVWLLEAEYEVIFSASGLVVFTATDGVIYADPNDVTAESSKEIATFRGRLELEVSFEKKQRREQYRFAKAVYFHAGEALLRIEEVTFRPITFDTLWDVTVNASDTLADDSTASTSYTVTQSSIPSYLQFLFHCTQTSDGKALEIKADRAVCRSLHLPFTKADLTVHDCEFLCLGDTSDNVVKVSLEN